MKRPKNHIAAILREAVKYLGLFAFLFLLSSPVFSQNTKGDRPVKNQRQVRETRGKSVKKKERGTTRDIAGRRLRTKGQSSANRANSNYRQPKSLSSRAKKAPDRAAAPRGRVFSKSPRESKTRAWRGDISGYRMKRVKPTGADAARHNVYPQKGPYVRYARKQPKKRPPVYSQTIKGTRFIKHRPRTQEHAWKGGVDKGPIKNQSATGSFKNVYSQKGPYVAYYRKRSSRKERAVSNKTELSQVKRYSKRPKTGGSQPRFYPSSSSRPYVQRGRRNVYWGKVQKKEKGVTTDITGGPVRTRNYRSPVAGLVGRDSLQFFGRKPGNDRTNRASSGGYVTASRKGQKSWQGDISGWPVRNPRKQRARSQKPLTPTQPGIGATWMSKMFNKRFKGVKPKDLIPDRRATRYQGNIKSFGSTKTFGDQGTGFPGHIKKGSRGFSRGGARYAGNINRNQQQGISRQGAGYSGTVKRSNLSEFSGEGLGYSGRIKRSQVPGFSREGTNYSGNQKRLKGFSDAHAGYSGTIKRSQVSGFSREGANYSGNQKRLKGFSGAYAGYSGTIKRSQVTGFSREGANYSGNQKRRGGMSGDYIGYSGNMKRSQVPGLSREGANYSGNQKQIRGFSGEYVGYSGTLKRVRTQKGGGSVSGILWNNKNQSVSRASITPLAAQTARFKGDIVRVGPVKQFNENGVGYSGFLPRGSLNKGFGDQGANFSGRNKFKKPEKGGGSVSGILWNNQETALPKKLPTGATLSAGFAGRNKYKKPEKGGGSVSGILWNNQETSLQKNIPTNTSSSNYSGRMAVSTLKKSHIQNPNASEASMKKLRPDKTAFLVSGLQVKVKEQDYSRNSHANKNSLPGIAPQRSSVKASEYARTMKQYWSYKHNPNSSSSALKAIAPGKSSGRISSFQGNVKMHKYAGSRLHPDAQFAHGEDDNVKGEKSFMTNVKLFWSKIFRKNETQPENLKGKSKKPQYDKREKGLWAY